MTTEAKNLLIRTINDYEAQGESGKRLCVSFVEKTLKETVPQGEKIGFPIAPHYIEAANVFLRIYKA